MALQFFVGVFSSVKKSTRGTVKEAVKRHNSNLEKLRLKETDCEGVMKALEEEELRSIKGLSAILRRVRETADRPRFDEISISSVELVPFDMDKMSRAAEDPAWYIGQSFPAGGSWRVTAAHTLTLSQEADKAWEEMEENEKKLNDCFAYYDALQILAENYTHSLEQLRGLYEKHISVLDQLKSLNGKTSWNDFGDAQRLAFTNGVQLSKLIYEMCQARLVKAEVKEEDISRLDLELGSRMLEKASRFCGEKGFDYDGTSYDVILRGSAKDYFKYCYRLEDKLCLLLPVTREQVPQILEKLRTDSDVAISRDVTHSHARIMLDKLRDVDIKSQRVVSPDGRSIYFIDIV